MSRIPSLGVVLLAATMALAEEPPASFPPFALVELFTSEGCSSCPRADDDLNAVAREARVNGQNVYALAWHVDYWNRLKTRHGVWADPFSSAAATERQKRYARALSSRRMGTPQLLLDGKPFALRGKAQLAEALRARLGVARTASVRLARTPTGIDWSVSGAMDGSELLVALVQRDIRQRVERGENHGRTLQHENVVRWHAKVKLGDAAESGSLPLDLPEGVPAESAGIIALVQHVRDRTVQAATGLDW